MDGRLSQPTAMRKAIARRMTESKQQVPHFYVACEVEMGAVEALVAAENERDPTGRVTMTAALVRAVAGALCAHPLLNSVWTEEGLLEVAEVNVGVAVALEGGLIAPALRGAEGLGLADTARALADLVERARAEKLRLPELTEGTFTLTNLGMFEVAAFTAIIMPPQVAILATGRAMRRIVPGPDGPREASILTVTLSADHRAVDGADGARFLQTFKHALEEPRRLLERPTQEEVTSS